MKFTTPHMETDLTWLTDGVTAVASTPVQHEVGENEPVELIVWKTDLFGPVVRLTLYPRSGLLYINGRLEEREDYISILELFDAQHTGEPQCVRTVVSSAHCQNCGACPDQDCCDD